MSEVTNSKVLLNREWIKSVYEQTQRDKCPFYGNCRRCRMVEQMEDALRFVLNSTDPVQK
jgi:hypothetical protein